MQNIPDFALLCRYQYQEVSSLGPQDKPGVVVLDISTLPVQKILPLGTGHLLLVNLEFKIDFLTALSGNSKSRARRELCGGIILKNLSIRSNILSITGDFNCILSLPRTAWITSRLSSNPPPGLDYQHWLLSKPLVLQHNASSSLKIEVQNVEILCDVSTGTPHPLVPDTVRLEIFSASHPGVRATRGIICVRFVGKNLNSDVKIWCESCEEC